MSPPCDGGTAQDRYTRQDKKKIARTTQRLKRLKGRLPEETADFVEELSADFIDYTDFFRLGHKQEAIKTTANGSAFACGGQTSSVRISGSSKSFSFRSWPLVFRAGHRAVTSCGNDQTDLGWQSEISVGCCARSPGNAPHSNRDHGQCQDFGSRIPSPASHSTRESNEEGRRTGW